MIRTEVATRFQPASKIRTTAAKARTFAAAYAALKRRSFTGIFASFARPRTHLRGPRILEGGPHIFEVSPVLTLSV